MLKVTRWANFGATLTPGEHQHMFISNCLILIFSYLVIAYIADKAWGFLIFFPFPPAAHFWAI